MSRNYRFLLLVIFCLGNAILSLLSLLLLRRPASACPNTQIQQPAEEDTSPESSRHCQGPHLQWPEQPRAGLTMPCTEPLPESGPVKVTRVQRGAKKINLTAPELLSLVHKHHHHTQRCTRNPSLLFRWEGLNFTRLSPTTKPRGCAQTKGTAKAVYGVVPHPIYPLTNA